jgi:hypothetical protein
MISVSQNSLKSIIALPVESLDTHGLYTCSYNMSSTRYEYDVCRVHDSVESIPSSTTRISVEVSFKYLNKASLVGIPALIDVGGRTQSIVEVVLSSFNSLAGKVAQESIFSRI